MSGTSTSMRELTTTMKPSDLIKLIEVCSKSEVSELTLGDLKVTFGKKNEQIGPNYLTDHAYSPTMVQSPINFQLDSEEDRLAALQLTDPVAYEEALVANE